MSLDISYIRAQFAQLNDDLNFVFCSNAGGSYVANQVNAILHQYNTHNRVQPYERYASSARAGAAMDRARLLWSQALNIEQNELTVGPSTSMNTYVMAQAIGDTLAPHDEIVVTNQDHEANSGVWRRIAEKTGATLREWRVQTDSGLLDTQDLEPLINAKTRWVFFTHCSNIIGTINPVKEITAKIKQNSEAKVFIDAVAYAPHHICDLKDLDVDGYTFSLYKVLGPHQSLLYIRSETAAALTPQCHYFNTDSQHKIFNPAGPQHAQVAACAGVIDYFNDLHDHHFGHHSEHHSKQSNEQPLHTKMQDLRQLIAQHETTLTEPILDFLSHHKQVRLLGKPHNKDLDRVPTIAFKPLKQSSKQVASRIQDQAIGCESGDFYATRLISDLGINPQDGVVRISLLHYSSEQDVEKILQALDIALNH